MAYFEISVAGNESVFLHQYDATKILPPDGVTLAIAELATHIILVSGLEKVRVLDLGTGSGAFLVAHSMGLNSIGYDGVGVDINPDSVAITHENLQEYAYGERAPISHIFSSELGDWNEDTFWESIGEEQFDVVYCNPPFLRKGEALKDGYEDTPESALFDEEFHTTFEELQRRVFGILRIGGVSLFRTSSDGRATMKDWLNLTGEEVAERANATKQSYNKNGFYEVHINHRPVHSRDGSMGFVMINSKLPAGTIAPAHDLIGHEIFTLF